jgi:lipoate-protein ligase A
MKYIDLSLPSPQENLACDEALLDLCEAGFENELLRFWESPKHFVVVGYANSVTKEANLDMCKADNIPVLRRLSGGGTVLQGPGCLNYSVILKIPESGPLASIAGTNKFVMAKQKAALEPLIGSEVKIAGSTDLAVGDLKFSGNAQRRKRKSLIFHGTLLLKFDIPLIEKYLCMPSKQPEYREGRMHTSFLMNLDLDTQAVKEAMQNEWKATKLLDNLPTEKIEALVRTKYSREEWNLKF